MEIQSNMLKGKQYYPIIIPVYPIIIPLYPILIPYHPILSWRKIAASPPFAGKYTTTKNHHQLMYAVLFFFPGISGDSWDHSVM